MKPEAYIGVRGLVQALMKLNGWRDLARMNGQAGEAWNAA